MTIGVSALALPAAKLALSAASSALGAVKNLSLIHI